MTLLSDLIAISKVVVGEAGDPGGASAEYPVLSLVTSEKREGSDAVTPLRLRRLTWTMRCITAAANQAAVAALRETLATTLAINGRRVRLTEVGGVRDMPKPPTPGSGAADGSLPGYPRLTISDIEEQQFGVWIGFTLTAETVLAVRDTGADSLVDHDYTRTVTEDLLAATSTTTQRGTVIVAPGRPGGAADWIADNIMAAVETAVGISEETLISKITTSQDDTRAEYEYTIGPAPEVSPGGGLESARVTDITREDDAGRIVRTISGEAKKGSAATTYALAQEPTPGTGEALITREVSEPNVSDGRVTFRYELIRGVVNTSLCGAGRYVLSFNESIRAISEGEREEIVFAYLGADPVVALGPTSMFEYEQVATAEWIGSAPPTNSTPVITFAMTGANLVRLSGKPERTMPRPGVYRESIRARFRFSTSQTIPNPRQVTAL